MNPHCDNLAIQRKMEMYELLGSFVNKICTLISFLTTFSYVLHYGPLEGSKDGKAKVLTYLDGMLALMLICTLYRC